MDQPNALFQNCPYDRCFLLFSPSGKSIFSYDGSNNNSSFQVLPGNWQTALNIACDRLRHHPILNNPQDKIAKEAKKTCQKYSPNWQKSNQTDEVDTQTKPAPQ